MTSETTAHRAPRTIIRIVSTTEKSTKPAPSRMRNQWRHKRSRRCHSARAPFIGVQLTAAMKRGLRRERNSPRPVTTRRRLPQAFRPRCRAQTRLLGRGYAAVFSNVIPG